MEGGPPVFPRDSSCPAVLWIPQTAFRFRIRNYHPLRCAFPYTSANDQHCLCEVRTPTVLLPSVWPVPRSLATTCGIAFAFSSSPYLDVSVQEVPLPYLFIQYGMPELYLRRIAPFGYLWVTACLRLTTAFRRLPRPSSAPGAKAFALRPS